MDLYGCACLPVPHLTGCNNHPGAHCACVKGPPNAPHLLRAAGSDESLCVLVAIRFACLQARTGDVGKSLLP